DHAQPARSLRHVDEADRFLHEPRPGVRPVRCLQPVRELPPDDAVRGEARLAAGDRRQVPPRRRRRGPGDARALWPHRRRVGSRVVRRARARAGLFRAPTPRAGFGQRRDRRARHVPARPVLGRVGDPAHAARPRMGWTAAPPGGVVVVAGAASRLGAFLLLRTVIAGEPAAGHLLSPVLAALAALTVGYAGLAALRTVDVRHAGAYLAMVPGGITILGLAAISPLGIA